VAPLAVAILAAGVKAATVGISSLYAIDPTSELGPIGAPAVGAPGTIIGGSALTVGLGAGFPPVGFLGAGFLGAGFLPEGFLGAGFLPEGFLGAFFPFFGCLFGCFFGCLLSLFGCLGGFEFMVQFTISDFVTEIISFLSFPFESSNNTMFFGDFSKNSWEIFGFVSSHIFCGRIRGLLFLAFSFSTSEFVSNLVSFSY